MIHLKKYENSDIKSKFKKGDFVYSIYSYPYGSLINDTKYEIYSVSFKKFNINSNIIIKNDNYLPHFEYVLLGEFGRFGPFIEKILQHDYEYTSKKYNI